MGESACDSSLEALIWDTGCDGGTMHNFIDEL